MNYERKKGRFRLLQKILISIVLLVDYIFLFHLHAFGDRIISGEEYLFAGYMCLAVVMVLNIHNRSVNLAYESEISYIFKDILLNMIFGIFYLALHPTISKIEVWKRIGILMLCNFGGIILVCLLINRISQKKQMDVEKVLFIYGGEHTDIHSELLLRGNQDVYFEEEHDTVLENAIRSHEVIYLNGVSAERRDQLIKICYENERIVYSTARLSDVLLRSSGISQDYDTPVYFFHQFGIGIVGRIMKRLFDIFFSMLALVVLSPLFVVLAVCIRMEDGGPVIYKQVRCTRYRKEFQIYKFRSMVVDAEKQSGICLSSEDDSRVTKIGGFIRKTKLDELPQLVNILKGEMSFVGPRPERPELIEETIKTLPEFVLRNRVKAGLTGYAQVRGSYNTDFQDKLKWDLMYIENYSLLLDIKIIIMTLFVVLQRKEKTGFEEREKE